jgi:hypothetical protein
MFTGPKQKDVNPGDYVLVAHGRWSRGVDFEGDKVYFLDNDEMLAVTNELPSEVSV